MTAEESQDRRERRSGEEEIDHPSGARITTLADGVFAIVMTLLVLGIEMPQVSHEYLDEKLVNEILTVWPKVGAFVVSFLVLGIYWMGHHTQFHFMRGVNRSVLWINIAFLMVVSLVPFTTRVVGHYGTQGIALWLYAGNLILISLVLLAHWRYVVGADLLTEAADEEIVQGATRQILVGPLIYVVAIAVSFFDARWALMVILVAPVLHILPGPIHLHWTR
ncbi:MAG: TMEM175 family protein [Gemmatimonadota bacterium]|nr:TMEM175 family protein [Gemmatimonadota bacterium]